MSIEIQITKEIGNYEPKFIGPLTLRQTACVCAAAPVCILIYTKLSPIITSDIAGFFCIFPAGIAAAIGWLRPYGMKTEEFVQSIFINMILAPTNRKYKIANYFAYELIDEDTETEDESEADSLPDKNEKNKKSKKRKKKYKLSSEAVK